MRPSLGECRLRRGENDKSPSLRPPSMLTEARAKSTSIDIKFSAMACWLHDRVPTREDCDPYVSSQSLPIHHWTNSRNSNSPDKRTRWRNHRLVTELVFGHQPSLLRALLIQHRIEYRQPGDGAILQLSYGRPAFQLRDDHSSHCCCIRTNINCTPPSSFLTASTEAAWLY